MSLFFLGRTPPAKTRTQKGQAIGAAWQTLPILYAIPISSSTPFQQKNKSTN